MSASTLALLAVLTLAADPPADLKLSNIRATHGLLGPKRTEKKVLPGESVFVCFDIDGITVNGDGKVQYSVATEVTVRMLACPSNPRRSGESTVTRRN